MSTYFSLGLAKLLAFWALKIPLETCASVAWVNHYEKFSYDFTDDCDDYIGNVSLTELGAGRGEKKNLKAYEYVTVLVRA